MSNLWKHNVKIIRPALTLILLLILILGCFAKIDSEGYYQVKLIDDPLSLPYKFTIKKKKVGLGNASNLILQQFVMVTALPVYT